MGLNGGGYTFIRTGDLAYLTDYEVQAMYTDKSNFLIRTRRAHDAAQPYGVLQQLSFYQYVAACIFISVLNEEEIGLAGISEYSEHRLARYTYTGLFNIDLYTCRSYSRIS